MCVCVWLFGCYRRWLELDQTKFIDGRRGSRKTLAKTCQQSSLATFNMYSRQHEISFNLGEEGTSILTEYLGRNECFSVV